MSKECNDTWKFLRGISQNFIFSSKSVDTKVGMRKTRRRDGGISRRENGEVVKLEDKLCLRKFPEESSFARVIEIKNTVEPVASGMDDFVERACMEREHRAYASLSRDLTISKIENCISDAICASSTNNYLEESIMNTLYPSDRVGNRSSYWSSKGERNPSAPDTLIYKLPSQLCLITELHAEWRGRPGGEIVEYLQSEKWRVVKLEDVLNATIITSSDILVLRNLFYVSRDCEDDERVRGLDN
ncbi:hypothetical protein DH2020_041966 [Rehmannia glutinosa]|uniref:Uncharacterized protein n=1 Tax=Rehmannia glutinosa TaxID=99300 RepID=A0ABR0UNQ8_REHGL